jgi:hypothetical protein
MFLHRESAIDFNLKPTTTMTTPYKLVKLDDDASNFIGKWRTKDYVLIVMDTVGWHFSVILDMDRKSSVLPRLQGLSITL